MKQRIRKEFKRFAESAKIKEMDMGIAEWAFREGAKSALLICTDVIGDELTIDPRVTLEVFKELEI